MASPAGAGLGFVESRGQVWQVADTTTIGAAGGVEEVPANVVTANRLGGSFPFAGRLAVHVLDVPVHHDLALHNRAGKLDISGWRLSFRVVAFARPLLGTGQQKTRKWHDIHEIICGCVHDGGPPALPAADAWSGHDGVRPMSAVCRWSLPTCSGSACSCAVLGRAAQPVHTGQLTPPSTAVGVWLFAGLLVGKGPFASSGGLVAAEIDTQCPHWAATARDGEGVTN